jgi:hypothetical protein
MYSRRPRNGQTEINSASSRDNSRMTFALAALRNAARSTPLSSGARLLSRAV